MPSMKENAAEVAAEFRKLVQSLAEKPASEAFPEALCAAVARAVGASALLAEGSGRVLVSLAGRDAERIFPRVGEMLGAELNERLNSILESGANVSIGGSRRASRDAAVFPLISSGDRVGTLIAYGALGERASAILEMAAALLSVVVAINRDKAAESARRDEEAVKSALSALSYSELAAALLLFKTLGQEAGIVVAGKIADELGFTRAIVVSAAHKLEAAGVIETRSLGMKGTYIKITNGKLTGVLNHLSYA